MQAKDQLLSLSSIVDKASSCRYFNWLDLVFSCALAIVFTLLVSVMEWPDAMDHISRKQAQLTIYPPDILSSYENLPHPSYNGEHSVFSDHYMYQPVKSYFWINLERLPLVLAIIVGLSLIAKKANCELLLFCPPLIFSFVAPSQEVLAISILIAAAVLSRRNAMVSVLLAVGSMFIDRSMVPNAFFVGLYATLPSFRTVVRDRRLILLIGVVLVIATSLVSPLDVIDIGNLKASLAFGISVEDVMDGAEHGQQKFSALAASTMGLFGWMSIRPWPFWIYYPATIVLFAVGFLKSQPSRQSLFIALFLLTYLVLWLIPSLAQARYFPLLTLMFWGMVMTGVDAINMKRIVLYSFVILATAIGCVVSLINLV